jgi:hypothetical protein
MRQHNLRILFFLLVLWGVAVACSRREARFHIFVEMGFTEYLTVHLAPPFILATLGNADTETCLAPGAGNRHSPKHEQKE